MAPSESSIPGRSTFDMSTAGQHARLKALRGRLAVQLTSPEAERIAKDAREHASAQSAWLWADYGAVLEAIARHDGSLPRTVSGLRNPAVLSMLAPVVIPCLGGDEDEVTAAVLAEAIRLPQRWRPPLRQAVSSDTEVAPLAAARLLDAVGTTADIGTLRTFVRRFRIGGADALLGRNLARALAPRVIVEDLGRSIRASRQPKSSPAHPLRRKVLALLVYLVSRPGFAATRDQVLDALWPDHQPTDAINSLNQTTYFLRRVFEPQYNEDSVTWAISTPTPS